MLEKSLMLSNSHTKTIEPSDGERISLLPEKPLFWFDENSKTLHCSKSRYLKLKRPGIYLTLLTSVAFSICGAIAKNVVETITATQTVAFRYVLCGFFMGILIAYNPGSTQMSVKKWIIGIIGGLAGGAATIFAYRSYKYIPLMDAQTIFNVQGIFVCVLACIILKETIGFVDVFSIVIILSGVMFISQPSFIFGETNHSVSGRNRLMGTARALLCAFFQGLTGVLCRVLREEKFYIFTFLISCGGIAISLATIPLFAPMVVPSVRETGQLLAIGLLACVSKCSITMAYQYEDATPVAMVESSQIVFSFFLQWAVFSTKPNYLEIIGAILVIAGICAITAKTQLTNWYQSLKLHDGRELQI